MESPAPDSFQAARRLELMPLVSIKAAARNPKEHAHEPLGKSIDRFGYVEPVILDERTGRLVAGHGRIEALRVRQQKGEAPPQGVVERGTEWLVPVVRGWSSRSDTEADSYLLASNQLTFAGGWNDAQLSEMLRELEKAQALDGLGFSDEDLARLLAEAEAAGAGGEAGKEAANQTLAQRFLVPPFSVLDARQGYWQERKKAWLALGLKSEVGRGENLLNFSDTVRLGGDAKALNTTDFDAKRKAQYRAKAEAKQEANAHLDEKAQKSLGVYASYGGAGALERQSGGLTGTSIFDPVLCELAYRWFVPKGGQVLDPFAGGSVRGVVASRLGLPYLGVDLRPEQVEANQEQAKELCPAPHPMPRWAVGDSRELAKVTGDLKADFVFSCPPYGDLEVYSEDARDLSTLEPDAFDKDYATIIRAAVQQLKPNRFACFVVGDYRDDKGLYRNFVAKTIAAFEAAGARLYNEAVLVTAVGTLAMRVGVFFGKGRKLGKAHQNVLVFWKGDPSKVAEELGEIEVPAEALQSVQIEGAPAEGAASEFGEELA